MRIVISVRVADGPPKSAPPRPMARPPRPALADSLTAAAAFAGALCARVRAHV
jgi:hypothetical protein